jgi:hypothetical protein
MNAIITMRVGNPGTRRLFVMLNGNMTSHPFRAAARAALIELALGERSESNRRHL